MLRAASSEEVLSVTVVVLGDGLLDLEEVEELVLELLAGVAPLADAAALAAARLAAAYCFLICCFWRQYSRATDTGI